MSTGREVRFYDYVNHPYASVRDALRKQALSVFQSATNAAAARAQSVAAELHVDFAGIGVNTDIKISVKSIEETQPDATATTTATTRLRLEWEASNMPRLFPVMNGELAIYALTPTETQLDFSGVYEPPFGPMGKALNAIAGHRIAEASVQRFVTDVAGFLRQTLA